MEQIDPYYPGHREASTRATNRRPGRGDNFRPLGKRPSVPRVEDITRVEAAAVGSTVVAALRAGLAVMFATTSDGGAVSVTLFDGDDRFRTYCVNDEELADALASISDRARRGS